MCKDTCDDAKEYREGSVDCTNPSADVCCVPKPTGPKPCTGVESGDDGLCITRCDTDTEQDDSDAACGLQQVS